MDGLPDDLRDFLFKHYDMPKIRLDKCVTMYHLAREAIKGGVIVEMGAWRGNGTITLCRGTQAGNNLEVHAIDQFENWKGWIGEQYSPEDIKIFSENILLAGVHPYLHVSRFADAAMVWKSPISLLIWDGGYSNPKNDIDMFAKFLIKGGVLAIRETYGQITFGALTICQEYAEHAKYTVPEWRKGGFYVTKRLE